MSWGYFSKVYGVTPQLYHLYTLCGAYRLYYEEYACICNQPSWQLPDDLQSLHNLQRIPVFDELC